MFKTGDKIGDRYIVRHVLGHGGMGMLWCAYDTKLARDVALKFFLGSTASQGVRERFEREAQAAGKLNHSNIVTIYEIELGDSEAKPYIVMEYIHGKTLDALIDEQVYIALPSKVRWLQQLCDAVGYAHGHGVIHRDIKPANLMVNSSGHLKVLDFGIARIRGTLVKNATAQVGTLGYSAPEQTRGGEIDHRTDLFSIGAVAYELLAGRQAFPSEDGRQRVEGPAPLEEVCPGLDPELAVFVAQAIQAEPENRFPSAAAMKEALAAVANRLTTPDATTTWYIPKLPPRPSLRPPTTADNAATIVVPKPGSVRPSSAGGRERRAAATEVVAQFQEHLRLAKERLAGSRVRGIDVVGELTAARHHVHKAEELDGEHPELLAVIKALNTACEPQVAVLVEQARSAFRRGDLTTPAELLASVDAMFPRHPKAEALYAELKKQRTGTSRSTSGGTDRKPSVPAVDATIPPGAAFRRSVTAPPFAPAVTNPPGRVDKIAPKPKNAPGTGKPLLSTDVRRWAPAIIGTFVIVLAGILAAVVLRSRPPSQPVRVVIDAVPWGQVTGVVRVSDGVAQQVAPGPTPLALDLEPAEYRVTLVGPNGETTSLPVRVDGGAPMAPVTYRFTPVSVDDYFAPLLGTSAPIAGGDADAADVKEPR